MAGSYSFGSFRLDPEAEILFSGAEPVQLGRRAVALLHALVVRPGVPLSKDALIEAAWPGLVVEESNLTVQIAALRRVLGEEPGGERWIETLPRRGYRFVGPVAQQDVASAPAAYNGAAPSLTVPDKPSIAVLPFQNMSGDPEQEYFADGMVEDIITALSRIKSLFVIARNSSFTYKGRAADVKQVGRELGVRYILEGSIRKAGNRVRITCQLIDASSDAHLWADHFDGSLNDIFDLQDKIAISVAGVIEPAVIAAEIRRSIQRQTTDLTVYDLYLRARAEAMSWERPRLLLAIDLLQHALEIDPYYGPALALAANCHQNLDQNNWSEDPERERQQSVELARRAIRAAGDDPYVLCEAAFVIGYFESDIHPAIVLIDRSLELNPSFAFAWFRSGWLRLWAGQIDLGIEHFENSLRFNPLRPAPPSFGIAVGHFFAGHLERAVAMLRLSLQENPTWPPCYRFLASCCVHLGCLDEARVIVRRLRDITPVVVPSAAHWRVTPQREFFLEGLRLAAGEKE
jgi:TolB-like protein